MHHYPPARPEFPVQQYYLKATIMGCHCRWAAAVQLRELPGPQSLLITQCQPQLCLQPTPTPPKSGLPRFSSTSYRLVQYLMPTVPQNPQGETGASCLSRGAGHVLQPGHQNSPGQSQPCFHIALAVLCSLRHLDCGIGDQLRVCSLPEP